MTTRALPVLVAPDSFKGTFTAGEVAEAVARGLGRAGVPATACRVADGGEGTLDVGAEGRRRRAGSVWWRPASGTRGRPRRSAPAS